ncbi:hypothetical protein U1Q18_045596 [Sarracenia purpurea var. burkii]
MLSRFRSLTWLLLRIWRSKGPALRGKQKRVFSRDHEEKFGEDFGETTYPSVEKGRGEEVPGSGTEFEPEGEDIIDGRAVSSAKDSSIYGVVPLVYADKAEPDDEETDSDSEEEVTSEEVDSAAEEDEESPDPGALMEKVVEAIVEETAEDNEAYFKEIKGSAEEKHRIPLVSEANLPESIKVSVPPCAQNVYVVDGLSPGSKDGNSKIQVGEKDGWSSHAHKVFDDLPQQVFMTITPFPVAASNKPSASNGGANLDEAVTEDVGAETEGEVTEVVSEEAVMRNKKEISGNLLPQFQAVLGEDEPSLQLQGGGGLEVKAPERHSWANIVKGEEHGPMSRQTPNLEFIAPKNPEESGTASGGNFTAILVPAGKVVFLGRVVVQGLSGVRLGQSSCVGSPCVWEFSLGFDYDFGSWLLLLLVPSFPVQRLLSLSAGAELLKGSLASVWWCCMLFVLGWYVLLSLSLGLLLVLGDALLVLACWWPYSFDA